MLLSTRTWTFSWTPIWITLRPRTNVTTDNLLAAHPERVQACPGSVWHRRSVTPDAHAGGDAGRPGLHQRDPLAAVTHLLARTLSVRTVADGPWCLADGFWVPRRIVRWLGRELPGFPGLGDSAGGLAAGVHWCAVIAVDRRSDAHLTDPVAYFQRKWTKTRPKLSESFSTRW